MSEHEHEPNVSSTACPACLRDGKAATQRMQRGFSDEDCWSFDIYLSKVIAGGVKVMRENLHGCPPELCDPDGDVDKGCERWAAILDEIALGFDGYTDANGERLEDSDSPEFERAFDLLRKWWPHLWD